MSILDSFFFVLKADSKDAVAGINKTGQEFEGLKTDVKVGTGDISRHFQTMGADVGASLADMTKGLLALGAASIAGMASLDSLADHVGQVIEKATNAKSLGIDIGDYDALSQSLRGAGLEADEARDLFVDLNEAIGEGASDAESQRAKTFKALGISLKDASGQARNAADIFGDLAAAADNLSPQQFTFQIRQLGINDPKTIQMLALGSKNLQEQISLAKQRGVMDQQQQQAAIKLAQSQRELKATISQLGDSIANGAIPAIQGMLNAVTKLVNFVTDHKEFMVAAFGVAAFGAVWMLRGQILGLIPVVARLAGATLVAVGPWLLLALGVALVAGLIEDLWLYFTDPNAATVTGRLAEKFSSVRDFLHASKEEVTALWEAMKKFGKDASEIWEKLIGYLNSFNDNEAFTEFVDNAKGKFAELRDFIHDWGQKIGDFLYNVFANVINGAIDTLNKLPGVSIERMQTGEERTAARGTRGLQSDGKAVEGVPLVPEVSLDEPEQHAQAAKRAHPVIAEQVPGIPIVPSVAVAQTALSTASATPLNSISQNSLNTFNNGGKTVNANQQIDKVEIHTAATDPGAILDVFNNGIGQQWKNTVAQHDDGISH